ncbi:MULTISPECIES: dihydroorotate dehydrogenase electron transfer subunit [Anaerococcus]|jgi:oxidoreductase FAD/NAD(P)-binding domain protein|uniref:Dihydroorotate dehydrogenase electron transfer subunit n=1 Tax=Anaerococcus octavius TaxID=54007 RepID=A0A2I1M9R7_9FIRM|nr:MULTISPECIES: dihydroorotate dehydrogenase electron transfer subunit [Anaerococcus]MBS6105779.1 dihydroorotate dehydrogenase electron transfer subunit [Anaerococcus sp.]MDU3176250.1 dihydroorotate dehydrogenase electron transfer subunit [Anaerococcus sp.]MDU7411329.1 dihydroorotate dehydrogenase electron transfer subunit [Anaerococcus sp.]PKZ16876.1 dihydroorotate dehydrogenase electron transfer subunit [Anaerococcus octavius]
MKVYKNGVIVENIEIAPSIWKMKVDIDLKANPGQFFMFRTESFRNEPLLSRPFGVCEQNENELTFLYQVVGSGTEIMADLTPGHKVKLLGPLGNGFDISKADGKKVAVVAGGIGIAPLLDLCKKLPEKADFYAGFTYDPYFVDEFKAYVNSITTTSFKNDNKFITENLNPDDYDIIYACGPNGLLKAIHEKNNKADIEVSMEAHMACGIGACLGCTIPSADGEFLRVCKDGPVFDAREVFK